MADESGKENVTTAPVVDQQPQTLVAQDTPGIPSPDDAQNYGIFSKSNDELADAAIGNFAPEESMQPTGGFDMNLMFRASQYGMTEDQARSYGTPELLNSTLNTIDQNILASQQDYSNQQAYPQNQQQNQPDPNAQNATNQTASEDALFQMDNAELDETVASQMDGMNKHYADQVTRMRQDQAAIVDYLREVESRRYAAMFEDEISELGDDWKPVFGTQATRTPGSPQQRNVDQQAKLLEGLWQSFPNATMQQLFVQALDAGFGEHKQRLYRNGLSQKARQQSATRMGRPSATQGPSLSGEQRATKAAAEFMRERGFV